MLTESICIENEIQHNTYERIYSVFIVDDEFDTLQSLKIVLEKMDLRWRHLQTLL